MVNTTESPKSIMPRVMSEVPIIDEKLKIIPRSISGIASLDPILAAGTKRVLNERGAYPLACCMACPLSWAATPIAAIELLEYTLSDNLSTFLDGS